MKSKIKPIFLIGLFIISAAALFYSPSTINAANKSESTISGDNSPTSAGALNTGLSVGDRLWFREFDPNVDPMDGPDSFDENYSVKIEYYEITDVTSDNITYDIYSAYLNESADLIFEKSNTEDYIGVSVFGHNIISNNITNISDYDPELETQYSVVYNCSTSNITVNTQTVNGVHLGTVMGFENDNASTPVNITFAFNATTGIINYLRFDEVDGSKAMEFMWIDSPNIVNDQPDTFGYYAGDKLEVFSPSSDKGYYNDIYTEPASAQDPMGYYSNDEWRIFDVVFVYRNLYTGKDMVITNVSFYDSPDYDYMVGHEAWRLEGMVDPTNDSSNIGSHFFNRNLDFRNIQNELNDLFSDMFNLTSANYTAGFDYFELTGTNIDGNVQNVYLERLAGYGFPKIMRMYVEDPAGNLIGDDTEITIEGLGVVESDPLIGVSEGDSWEYLAQHKESNNWWSSTGDNDYWEDSAVEYLRVKVTYIFQLRDNEMAVIGDLIHTSTNNPAEVKTESFVPLLIFDPDEPWSFIDSAGYDVEMDGPPLLMPLVSDWSVYENEIYDYMTGPESPMNNDGPDDGDIPIGPSVFNMVIESNLFAFSWNGKSDNPEFSIEGHVILQVDSHGITTQLRESEHGYMNYMDDSSNEYGSDWDHEMDAFLISSDLGCTNVDPATIFNFQDGDTFIWTETKYDPYEENPMKTSQDKFIIRNLEGSCDGTVVILGEKYWMGDNATDWESEEWEFQEGSNIWVNYWVLSSVQPGVYWSWIDSNFFDPSISDWSTIGQDIVDLINFAAPLPPNITVTLSDMSFQGRSFTANIPLPDGDTLVLRFAANDLGVLQDMFMGMQYSNGTWANWERTVLTTAPDDNAVGEVFNDNIPDNYEPVETNTEPSSQDAGTNPFGSIPGYPMEVIALFGLIGVVMIIKKYKREI